MDEVSKMSLFKLKQAERDTALYIERVVQGGDEAIFSDLRWRRETLAEIRAEIKRRETPALGN